MHRSLPCLGLLAFVGALTCQAQTITQVVDNGPRANRLNMVIFSEGYTNGELGSKFPADAQNLINKIFAAEPMQEYKSYFNVFTIAVASAESGSDHPSQGLYKNTYFNSSFDSSGTERLLTIPPNSFDGNYADGQGKVDTLSLNLLPDYDLRLMSVNDNAYGGSGGQTAIGSTNASAAEIMIHETGHSFAGLTDEYTTPYPGFPLREYPNATQQTSRSMIVWRNWIADMTPVPTPATPPYASAVGLYEGAEYNTTGWYRPKQNCKMNSLNTPFCEICAEAFVLTFLSKVSMIDAASPTATSVNVSAPTQFIISKLQPRTHSLTVQWSLDGNPIAGATMDSYTIDPTQLSSGTHQLTVTVHDPTTFVRTDPVNRLTATRNWTLNVSNAGGTAPVRLGNLAARMRVETGDSILIGGFIVSGTMPKKVIVVAKGPSFNLSGTLSNPTLELHGPNGLIASNDDWGNSPDRQAIIDSTVGPSNALESALIATLPANRTAYTALVRGVNGTSGIGSVEIYDLDSAADSTLANISCRGRVQTGDNVMIGGFIVTGPNAKKVIVRSLGPSLNIAGKLPDPTLTLYNRDGVQIAANDNWRGGGQEQEIIASTVQPGSDLEPALIATIPPGGSTVLVRGQNNSTGIATVEIYALD